jgi:hypothetical protein
MNDQERGFVLPAALLTVTVLLILTTAGFYTVRQETKIGASNKQAADAFYLAESGISDVIASWDNASYDAMAWWTTRSFADTTDIGTWAVTVTKANEKVFYLDATGTITAGGPMLSGATRRLGLAARMTLPDFNTRAALTTMNNVNVRGRAEIHGEDIVPPNWSSVCAGTLNDKAGVLIDDTAKMGQAGKGKLTGAPPVLEDKGLTSSTFTQFGDLDWAELVRMASKVYPGGSLNVFLPSLDANGNCDVADRQNWGDPENPTAPCGNYFPVIYIASDTNLQSGTRGQGILLIDGQLQVRGDFIFHGLVIAQGDFDAQGAGNRVYGAVMAANVTLDQQQAVGASALDYSSCAIERAIINATDLNRARPLGQRGWVDMTLVPGS